MAQTKVLRERKTEDVPLGGTRVHRRLRVSLRAKLSALLTATLALLVLAGWLFEVEVLKRFVPGLVAMNPLSAIAFLVAATCLWLSSSQRGSIRPAPSTLRLLRGGATFLTVIGASKLLAILLGLDFPIDRLLFAAQLETGSALPNEMAPNSAFNFLLIGCAFLFLHVRNGRVNAWACVFALVSGFEALLALLGYAYGIKALYGVGSFIPMALHSAVCFLLLAWGLMCCQAQRGFFAVVLGKNAGGTMARRLLPAAILIPALLGWLRLEGQRIGLYDAEFGVALYTVMNMVVLGSIVCCNALSLFRTDAERTKAERRLRGAHDELEKRVQNRTAELSNANAALVLARDRLEERVQERTATLAESEARLNAILDGGTSVVYLKDLEGRYLLANRCFAKLLGRPREEIIGRQTSELFADEAAKEFGRTDHEALRKGAPIEVEELAVQEDGVHTFASTKFPLRNSAGEIYALCGIAHDITERVQANKALRTAESEANRANLAKSEFLSRMSHELRTPMNAILGFAQLLELDELNNDQRDGINHILNGGRHLLDLINEVLDISRIEAGHLSLSLEPVEISDAIRETLNLVQPLATAREVRLHPSAACAFFVRADRQRLKQVLINLLSNAIKYNRLGGSVTISCQPIEDRLRVSITDTGIGIPAERINELFVPFERLGAEQSTVEGTGLGLAVAKRLTEAMEGTMGVESSAGQGSTFWVEFRLVNSPLVLNEVPEPAHTDVICASAPGRTVLYIEDNLSNLRLIERLMERRPEITLLAATDGLLGLKMAREHRPDLVLLDLNLPDIDGHEILVRLRANPDLASIPVVVLSADATKGQITKLTNAGAFTYLTKPLEVRKFYEVLDSAIALQHSSRN